MGRGTRFVIRAWDFLSHWCFVISHSRVGGNTVRVRRTLATIAAFACVLAHSRIAQSAETPWAGKATYVPKLEKNLKENITAFWLSKSLDRSNGGYTINFGPKGEPKGPGTKMIVTQARTVWLFSRLVRAGYGGPEYLQAAEHGYRFLKEKMWDAKNGGFYWEVDATGNQKLKPRKHLYGQAFGLYALSEYYLTSKKKEALDLAIRL